MERARGMAILTFLLLGCSLFVVVNSSLTCPNTNIVINEIILDSPILEELSIVWLKPTPTQLVAFLITKKFVLWTSADGGKSWSNITLPNGGEAGIRTIFLSSDSKSAIILGMHNHMWNTFDGINFHHVDAPGELSDLKFHPLHSDWVIGIVCENSNMYYCFGGRLYLSQDSGTHWAQIRTNVRVADWHGLSDDEKMIVTWEDRYLYSSRSFFRTDPSVLSTDVVGYKSVGSKIFIATVGTSSLILSVSEDFGETFYAVRFPLGLDERRYSLLDTTEGLTFINVQHDAFDDTWGNVYASNSFDTDFTLSLERNVRAMTGKCEFKAVGGLEGIYLANQYAGVSGDQQVGYGKQTVITYDKGSKWQRLGTPSGITCTANVDGDCNLNLVGISEGGVWFSRKEAVGLIIASGSVSQYLVNKYPDVGMYISRDAGWTWNFVSTGRFTYEIGNSGSIILAIQNDKAINSMNYSLNEGATWSACQFSNHSIEIQDIVTDPDSLTGLFIAYGSIGEAGVLLTMDFTSVYPRLCQGHDNPSDPSSDYEEWEPSDARDDECLLGRRTKYLRRKQQANCFNPTTYVPSAFFDVKNCSCTMENYECDYCYKLVQDQCVPDVASQHCLDYDPKTPPPDCLGKYDVTRGYRRVSGDTCDTSTGVNLLPIPTDCPSRSPSPPAQKEGHPGLMAAFLIMLVLCSIGGGLWWYSGQNEKLRGYLRVVIPERFLPEFVVPVADYNTVPNLDDVEEDAPEITIEDSVAAQN